MNSLFFILRDFWSKFTKLFNAENGFYMIVNIEDPDEMLQFVASHLEHHRLVMSHFQDKWHIWAKVKWYTFTCTIS